jgi:hypothetical protein
MILSKAMGSTSALQHDWYILLTGNPGSKTDYLSADFL